MNKIRIKIAVCLTILLISMAMTGTVFASEGYTPLLDDEVVFFGTYTLESGETLVGNLVVFGGVVSLKEDSTVDGDVVIFGGNVTVDGEIESTLVAIGGVVSLSETAVVRGDLIAPAAVVRRDEGARILGQIVTENVPNIEIPEIPEPDIPPIPEIPQPTFADSVSKALRPVVSFFGTLARALVFSAVSVLALLVMPKQSKRVRSTIEENPVLSGGFGLLSVAVFTAGVIVLALLSITIILIPVTIPLIILLSLALALGLLFGLIVAGAEVGRRMMIAFKQEWTPTLQVAIGSFSMSFILGLLSLGFLGFFGGLFWTVAGAMGLGAVLLTRFGTREYIPASQ
jgi:cytoskeletal protein CcmA (bactofilin family)